MDFNEFLLELKEGDFLELLLIFRSRPFDLECLISFQVNSEYYTGWLDHWGEPHQRRAASTIATYLDKILAVNASVNM